ncbi:MAG: MoaD family protein [Bacillota bacterium]
MEVKFYGELKKVMGYGKKEVNKDNIKNIENLIKYLVGENDNNLLNKFINDGKLNEDIIILKNGKRIRFDSGLKTKIAKNDKIVFFPPSLGG